MLQAISLCLTEFSAVISLVFMLFICYASTVHRQCMPLCSALQRTQQLTAIALLSLYCYYCARAPQQDAGGISSDDEHDAEFVNDANSDNEEDSTTATGTTASTSTAAAASSNNNGRNPLPQGQPVKSGYLWKRSTNVRRDWKRRFFIIQNGKLCYQRQVRAV
jgi:hypothetical protein